MSKTSNYPHGGFTLIELLVVVLIIGILAAIALPQYRRTVEKARATEAMTLINAVNKSIDTYYLVNNVYPQKFADLDMEISWTGKEQFYYNSAMSDFVSNGVWSIGLEGNNANVYSVIGIRLSGYYRGAGFILMKKEEYETILDHIVCTEWLSGEVVFDKEDGEFCFNVIGASKKIGGYSWGRYYQI